MLEAIANKSGSSNVWIGSGAGPVANMEINNSIAIGPDAHTSKSSQIVIGNGQSDEVLFMDGELLLDQDKFHLRRSITYLW